MNWHVKILKNKTSNILEGNSCHPLDKGFVSRIQESSTD